MTKKEPFVSGKRKMLLAELSALERKEREEAKLAELRKRGTVGKVYGFDCEETSGCASTGEPPDQTVPLGCVRAREHLRDEPHDCTARLIEKLADCVYGSDDTCGLDLDKAEKLIGEWEANGVRFPEAFKALSKRAETAETSLARVRGLLQRRQEECRTECGGYCPRCVAESADIGKLDTADNKGDV